jgi:hypothetical protein
VTEREKNITKARKDENTKKRILKSGRERGPMRSVGDGKKKITKGRKGEKTKNRPEIVAGILAAHER